MVSMRVWAAILVAVLAIDGPVAARDLGPKPDEILFLALDAACQDACRALFDDWVEAYVAHQKAEEALGRAKEAYDEAGARLKALKATGGSREEIAALEKERQHLLVAGQRAIDEMFKKRDELDKARKAYEDCLRQRCGKDTGGFNPAQVIIPILGGGFIAGGVILNNGSDGPLFVPPVQNQPTPGASPSTAPPPPPPAVIDARIQVVESQGTRVLNGTATGHMDGSDDVTLHRQTNNCGFFLNTFGARLVIGNTGGPATGPAEATGDGSFNIAGVPVSGHIDVTTTGSSGGYRVKRYALSINQGGVMCTDAFMTQP